MPDPIWLDTNVVDRVIKGDIALDAELRNLRRRGHRLLMVPAANNELLNGNPLKMKGTKPVWEQAPTPASKVRMQIELKRLGIELDMSSAKLSQETRVNYAMQRHVPRKPTEALPKSLNNISESDSLVLSQVKASAEARGVQHPVMFTAEQGTKAMITQAHVYGVTPMTLNGNAPPTGGNAAAAAAKSPKVPKIDLSQYPPDKEGPISKFFKDRPKLAQAGLLAGQVAAQLVSAKMLEMVQSHFSGVLKDAQKDFRAKYPDAASLWRNGRIDQHKQAYEAALAKLKAPSNAKVAGAVMVAVAPEKDQAAVWRHVQDRLSRVKLADGAMGSYGAASSAYINAMADLGGLLAKYQTGLPEIADDIRKRASLLEHAGNELEKAFWTIMHVAVFSPITYYQTFDIHHAAEVFLSLAGNVGGFAAEISGRMSEYERMGAQLDKELIKVSEEMGKYVP